MGFLGWPLTLHGCERAEQVKSAAICLTMPPHWRHHMGHVITRGVLISSALRHSMFCQVLSMRHP